MATLTNNEAGNLIFSINGSAPRALIGAGKSGVKVHKDWSGQVHCNQRMRVVRGGYKARDFRTVKATDFCSKCFTAEQAQEIIDSAKAVSA